MADNLIDQLAFNKVRYIDRWTLAEQGDFLQTTFNDQIIIGMRTTCTTMQGGDDALLALGNDHHGLLIPRQLLGTPCAVVLTDLVEVVATDIRPFDPLVKSIEFGNVLQKKETDDYFAWTSIIDGSGLPSLSHYICIASGTRNIRGESHQTISTMTLHGISRAFTLVDVRTSESTN